jgi:hypothetical protein
VIPCETGWRESKGWSEDNVVVLWFEMITTSCFHHNLYGTAVSRWTTFDGSITCLSLGWAERWALPDQIHLLLGR